MQSPNSRKRVGARGFEPLPSSAKCNQSRDSLVDDPACDLKGKLLRIEVRPVQGQDVLEAPDTCPIQRHNRHPEKSATTIALYRPGGRPFLNRSRRSTSFCPSSSFIGLWQIDDVGARRMDRTSSISQDSSRLSSHRAACFDENPGAYRRDKRRSRSRYHQLHESARGENDEAAHNRFRRSRRRQSKHCYSW